MSREILLHLSLIPQAGPATVEKLVQAYALQELDQLYTSTARDLMHYAHLTQAAAERIVCGLADRSLLDQELKLIQQYDISWTTLYDVHYPALLKHIYLPPLVLYSKGVWCDTERALAVVGSRKADAYGMAMLKHIILPLASTGWTIVSGGALGIDTYAHKIALEAGGKTVAVLGSGLLCPYPKSNTALFRELIHKGSVLISPFPLRMPALVGNFPARNRIIAGMSKACLIVQAAEKSGALITAHYALEQGKEVGAVPGPLDSPLSAGCHKLIQQGAALISSADDMRLLVHDTLSGPVKSVVSHHVSKPVTPYDYILEQIKSPLSFDELLVKTGYNAAELQDYLWQLQLERLIVQNWAGLWQHA